MSRALKVGAIVFLLAILAGIVRSQNGAYQSPATGATYTATSPITVTGTVIACPTCGTGTGNALTSNPLSQFAATTSAQLAGVLSDETGTGLAVFGTSPTLTTPVIGAATGTSLSVSGQLTSTVATGTAPLAVSSTTVVPNLNANSLNGQTFAAPAALGSSSPNSVNWSSLLNQAHMVCTGANPTIGTGAGATIASGNGSCSFTINVGTGGLSSIVIAFSGTSVQSGWICSANDRTTHSATVFQTVQTNSALSTTTATISNLTSAGATGTAWTNSDLLSLQCAAD